MIENSAYNKQKETKNVNLFNFRKKLYLSIFIRVILTKRNTNVTEYPHSHLRELLAICLVKYILKKDFLTLIINQVRKYSARVLQF